MGAWMDLAKEVTSVEDTRYAGLLQLVKAGMSADEFNNVSEANRILAVNAKIKEQHAEKFPFGAMLSTIMFLLASDLDDKQRMMLTQSLSLKGLQLQTYKFEDVCDVFMELFQNPRGQLDDPAVKGKENASHRTFFILQETGSCYQGMYEGIWCVDVETMEEGFLPDETDDPAVDEFWQYVSREEDPENGNTWIVSRFGQRQFQPYKKGKGKGKRWNPGPTWKSKKAGFRPFKLRRTWNTGKRRSYAVDGDDEVKEWDVRKHHSGSADYGEYGRRRQNEDKAAE